MMAHRGWRIIGRKKKEFDAKIKVATSEIDWQMQPHEIYGCYIYAVRYICICVYTLSDPIAAVTGGVGLNDAYALRNVCIINRCISLCLFLCVYIRHRPRARLRICAM